MGPTLRLLMILVSLALLTHATPATAQTDQRCFPETRQCVSGPIRAYWERNGGLAVFGFPIPRIAQRASGRRG